MGAARVSPQKRQAGRTRTAKTSHRREPEGFAGEQVPGAEPPDDAGPGAGRHWAVSWYGITALTAFPAILLIAMFFADAVSCPGSLTGVGRVLASFVVGLPIGGGLTALTLIGLRYTSVGHMSPGLVQAVKKAIERGALGATFGTLLAIESGIIVSSRGESTCRVEILDAIGDGATWGTLCGLSMAIGTLVKAHLAFARDAEKSTDPTLTAVTRSTRGALMPMLCGGLFVTYLIIDALLRGSGWDA